jgi:glycosyltransferase involved in cell wall biosynthesis
LRIAVTTIHETSRGGVETYLAALVPYLRSRGHEVQLFSEEAAAESTSGAGSKCVERVIQFAPDVVLQNSLSNPADELALIRAGLSVVFFAHAYGGMCISGSRRHGFPSPRVCQREFGGWCWVYYFARRCGGLNPLTALALYEENQVRRQALLSSGAVVVASRAMAAVVKQHGVPESRIEVIPYFVAPPENLSVDALRERWRARRALFIGRFTDLKGWRELVDACALRNEHGERWTLVCAGTGPASRDLERHAVNQRVALELHPWLSPGERDEVIKSGTLLVLPSTWPEPFGLVGLEAARLGVPAVAFDIGGVREWLVPGRTGLLAAPPSAESLAAAIADATNVEEQYVSMAQEALIHAAHFGVGRHVTRLEEVLGTVAHAARQPV